MYDNLLQNEPILMPWQAYPFNNDHFIAGEMLFLRDQFNIKTVIECGACVGGSTKWFSENFENVTAIEINETFFNLAKQRATKANIILANTTDVLADLIRFNTLLYLDDHWNDYFPLFDELNIIAASGIKPVIAIHDCLVPNSKLGYDSYKNVDISFENIKEHLEAIYGVDGYQYNYNSDEESTEVKRGIIYIYPIL